MPCCPYLPFKAPKYRLGRLSFWPVTIMTAAESGSLLQRVMRGENPANIPVRPFTKTKLIINLEAARATGLKIPSSLLQKAGR